MNLLPCFTPPFKARLVPQRNDGEYYFIAAIETETHMPIATVAHPTLEDPKHEELIMHTARLFAAAPELLAACQAAEAYLTPQASRFKSNRIAAAEIIRAAITKATTA